MILFSETAGTGSAYPCNTETDALMARVKQGDHEAFTALYNEFHSYIFTVIRRFVWDNQQAEDYVQEVFAIVWRKREDWAGYGFTTWIISIARNTAFNHRKRDPVAALETSLDDKQWIERFAIKSLAPEEPSSPPVWLQALDALSPTHREAIEAVYLNGSTPREFAAELGVSTGCITGRCDAAKRKLREFIEKSPTALQSAVRPGDYSGPVNHKCHKWCLGYKLETSVGPSSNKGAAIANFQRVFALMRSVYRNKNEILTRKELARRIMKKAGLLFGPAIARIQIAFDRGIIARTGDREKPFTPPRPRGRPRKNPIPTTVA